MHELAEAVDAEVECRQQVGGRHDEHGAKQIRECGADLEALRGGLCVQQATAAGTRPHGWSGRVSLCADTCARVV